MAMQNSRALMESLTGMSNSNPCVVVQVAEALEALHLQPGMPRVHLHGVYRKPCPAIIIKERCCRLESRSSFQSTHLQRSLPRCLIAATTSEFGSKHPLRTQPHVILIQSLDVGRQDSLSHCPVHADEGRLPMEELFLLWNARSRSLTGLSAPCTSAAMASSA